MSGWVPREHPPLIPSFSPKGEGANENAARWAAFGESLLDQATYFA